MNEAMQRPRQAALYSGDRLIGYLLPTGESILEMTRSFASTFKFSPTDDFAEHLPLFRRQTDGEDIDEELNGLDLRVQFAFDDVSVRLRKIRIDTASNRISWRMAHEREWILPHGVFPVTFPDATHSRRAKSARGVSPSPFVPISSYVPPRCSHGQCSRSPYRDTGLCAHHLLLKLLKDEPQDDRDA